MPLEVTREMKHGAIRGQIEPDKYTEDEFLARIAFREGDDSELADYVLAVSAEDRDTLKDLIAETFRHMQTYLARLPNEDGDDERRAGTGSMGSWGTGRCPSAEWVPRPKYLR